MNLRRALHDIVAVLVTLLALFTGSGAQTPAAVGRPGAQVSKVWVADNGDGTYRNPVIHADFSDPDAVRVGDDFYMTASSFNAAPGLPVLHSKDLVNWSVVGYALKRQPPFDVFDRPQHGGGVWAPAIRHHGGEFYIYYPDPDRGIYVVKAKDAAGPWSEPLLVKEAKGWIDPCPLWDEDGRAYLVTGVAASRSGVKSILVVSRMNAEGTRLLDDGVIVFDGHDKHPTVEGPKFHKRNGYYYILAPAGGVETGWQLALRSRSVYGPYEEKVVLAQGKSTVNGPHQGAWVETQTGEHWFLHFQDKGAYGRVVHLQPMRWVDDWPLMGTDADGDGTGEPVLKFKKPNVGRVWPVSTPPDSDEFDATRLGLQWQWHANPQTNWAFPAGPLGYLRVINVPLPEGHRNLWDVPSLLLQKFPAPEFTATTKLTFTPRTDDEKTGLLVMGLDYAYLSVRKRPEGLFVSQVVCKDADKGGAEREGAGAALKGGTVYLRVKVTGNAVCNFSFSEDGKSFRPVGEPFTARPGRWIGAKVGLFASRVGRAREYGYADFDWFRFE